MTAPGRSLDAGDTGQDEVDAGQELLAVVVAGQLGRHLAHERILSRGHVPRNEAEAADAHELVDLCLGDRAPYGLIEFFTRAASIA